MVRHCRPCITNANTPTPPLSRSLYPDRPWEKVGSDLFYFSSRWYLLVVDYYSRYVEIALLQELSSSAVINQFRSIFARHGIPDILVSDNGPQYASQEFKQFAQGYGFQHVTSSPKYPQSNGAAERAVQTVKQMLKKEA